MPTIDRPLLSKTKPPLPPKPKGKLTGKELPFEKWEEKLPWVKAYKALLSMKVLSEKDCDELPKCRINAIEMHINWARSQKIDVTPVYRKQIEEKFQAAVNNIVSEFCEPREKKYSTTIDNLRQQTPQRNDHELLNDELKTQYIAAAAVRYSAANSRLYNPNTRARIFAKGFTPGEAESTFLVQKEAFKQRYADALNHDKTILQTKFSELDSLEKTLEDSYKAGEDSIRELKKAILTTTEQIHKKMADMKPVAPSSDPDTAIISDSIIPTPPAPPPCPLLPTFLSLNQPSKMPAVGSETKLDFSRSLKASFVPTANLFQSVKLKSAAARGPAVSAVQDKLQSTEPHPSKKIQAPVLKALPKAGKRSSIEELEATLERNALSIYKKEQLHLVLRERNKHQSDVLAELTQQKKSLDKLLEQIKQLEIQKKQKDDQTVATEPAPVPFMGSAPPPPPPPPLPPMMSQHMALSAVLPPALPAKKHFSQQPKLASSDTVDAQKPDGSKTAHKISNAALDKELVARLLARRKGVADVADDMADDDTPEEVVSYVDEDAIQKEKAQKAREKQDQQTTVARYAAKAKDIFAQPHCTHRDECEQLVSTIKGKIVKLGADINRLSLVKTIEELAAKIGQLAEADTSFLEDKAPLPVELHQPTTKKYLSVTAPLVPVIDSVAQSPIRPLNYQDKIKAILSNDPELQEFYNQTARYKRLHAALQKISPDKLNKSIVTDLFTICDYVGKKLLEIPTKKLSPQDKKMYFDSLISFYEEALAIRLSDKDTNSQRRLLKESAHKHFKPRDPGLRLLADALIVIGTLFVGGLVGGLVVGVAWGTSCFFSQQKSKRELDFRKRLNDKGSSDEEGLLQGSLSLVTRTTG